MQRLIAILSKRSQKFFVATTVPAFGFHILDCMSRIMLPNIPLMLAWTAIVFCVGIFKGSN